MKKLMGLCFIILGLFSLSSCDSNSITNTLFIASMGIEKEEDQYVGYFFLPLTKDMAKNENNEGIGKGEYAKVKGKSLADIILNLSLLSSLNVNLKHVSSIIINKELLEKKFIDELCNYIKYSSEMDYNCYLFTTDEKISDLFTFQIPNKESVLHSILVSTYEVENLFPVPPLHFLEFVRKYYANRTIVLPELVLEELWYIDDKESKSFNPTNAIYYHQGKTMEIKDDSDSKFIYNVNKFYDQIKENSVCFDNYKLNLAYDEQIVVDISFNCQIYGNNTSLSSEDIIFYVKDKVEEYIRKFKDVDPFDIKYINDIHNKFYTYEDIIVNVNINKN